LGDRQLRHQNERWRGTGAGPGPVAPAQPLWSKKATCLADQRQKSRHWNRANC